MKFIEMNIKEMRIEKGKRRREHTYNEAPHQKQ